MASPFARILLAAVLAALPAAQAQAARDDGGRTERPRKAKKPKGEAAAPAPATPRLDPSAHAPPAPADPLVQLLKLTETQARAHLGAPDFARTEGAGGLWTYRLRDCALLVFFRRDAGQPLRVSGAASSPRRRGETAAPVNACIAEAQARRAR